MKRLIDSKLVKKIKNFLTGNNYDEETNTTEIGGNLEVDGSLDVGGDTHTNALYTSCSKVTNTHDTPGIYFEYIDFNEATSTISPLTLKSWTALSLITKKTGIPGSGGVYNIAKFLTIQNNGVTAGGEQTLQTHRGWNTLFTIKTNNLTGFGLQSGVVASGILTYADSVLHQNSHYQMRLKQSSSMGKLVFDLEIYIGEDGITITPSDLSASGTKFNFE